MLSKKLTTLLDKFNKREFLRFGKFIRSPYHNENERIILLYEILLEFKKADFEAKIVIEKKTAWQEIFGKEKYEDVKMRRLTSEMTTLAENFLVLEETELQPGVKKYLLLSGLKNKDAEKQFFEKAKKMKTAAVGKSTDYHFECLQTEIIQHEFIDSHVPQTNTLKSLSAADYHLDSYYTIKKLKFYCSLLSYQSVHATEVSFSEVEKILENTKNSVAFTEPAVKVYYQTALLLQKNNSDDIYNKLRESVIQYENCFPLPELQQIYFHLQNYCAVKINDGKTEYYKWLFDIYKTMIKRNILLGKEDLKPGLYKNIITLGVIMKDFSWSENFIQAYTDRLPKEHRENAQNYNLAKVYYHKKEYQKVIEQLQEVEYKNIIYALGGKMMLVMTYFEIQEVRSLDSLIDSFRIYLRRNKLISKNVRQQYMNSLRFTKKLLNVAPYDTKGLLKVKEQVIKCKSLAAKQWLLEKIKELE